MAIIVKVKSSVRWLPADTCAESYAVLWFFCALSVAIFMLKFKKGCLEFTTSRKEVAAWRPGMIANVSLTYRLQ